MKTVATSVEEAVWEGIQCHAAALGKNVDELLLRAMTELAEQQGRGTPLPEGTSADPR
jgi:hypothetical protein